MNLKFYGRKELWNNQISLHIASKQQIAQPIVFIDRVPSTITIPCLTLELEEAQLLMDELWSCGLRPSEGTGSAGSLAATERHLKDMQEIAKGLLKKTGVNLP